MRLPGLRSLCTLLPALALACASPSPSAPEQVGATPSAEPEPTAAAPAPGEPSRSESETRKQAKPDAAAPDTMDAALADPAPPAAPSPEPGHSRSRLDIAVPSINGGLNRDIIRRIASDHADDIRDCHGRALASMPDLAGKLTIELWLNESGRVTNAELTGTPALNDRIGQCVVALAMGWSFADAGGEGSFELAFDFAPE